MQSKSKTENNMVHSVAELTLYTGEIKGVYLELNGITVGFKTATVTIMGKNTLLPYDTHLLVLLSKSNSDTLSKINCVGSFKCVSTVEGLRLSYDCIY